MSSKLMAQVRGFIKRPVTHDQLTGYDEFNQFMIGVLSEDGELVAWRMGANLVGQKCPLCGQRWVNSSESLDDQVYDRETRQHVHRGCMGRLRNFTERERVIDWLSLAWMFFEVPSRGDRSSEGYVDYDLREVPNRYWPPHARYDDVRVSWFEIIPITEPMSPRLNSRGEQIKLEIRRRKRVWELCFIGLEKEQVKKLSSAFKDVPDTQQEGAFYYVIHAWTQAQAISYLRTYREVVFGAIPPRGAQVTLERMREKHLG